MSAACSGSHHDLVKSTSYSSTFASFPITPPAASCLPGLATCNLQRPAPRPRHPPPRCAPLPPPPPERLEVLRRGPHKDSCPWVPRHLSLTQSSFPTANLVPQDPFGDAEHRSKGLSARKTCIATKRVRPLPNHHDLCVFSVTYAFCASPLAHCLLRRHGFGSLLPCLS